MTFLRAFSGEMRKLARPRGLIILAVIFVVFFVFFAVIYNLNIEAVYESLSEFLGENDVELTEDIVYKDGQYYYKELDEEGNVVALLTEAEYAEKYGYINVNYIGLANEENVDKIIAELSFYKESLEELLNSGDYDDEDYEYSSYKEQIAEYKRGILILEYMKKHDAYGTTVDGWQSSSILSVEMSAKTAESFTLSYFEAVMGILLIYGVVIAAGSYADEYKRGTIKLVMLRPISRNTLTAAKLTALFAYLAAIGYSAALVAYIYSAIRFGSHSTAPLLVLFNGTSVFKTTLGGKVMLHMFLNTISAFASVTLAFTIGTVMRKKTGAIVISFVILSGIISALFSAFGVGMERFLFSTNTDLTSYFGMNYNITKGYNFFIALPVLVAYLSLILTALFLTVKKRDVI